MKLICAVALVFACVLNQPAGAANCSTGTHAMYVKVQPLVAQLQSAEKVVADGTAARKLLEPQYNTLNRNLQDGRQALAASSASLAKMELLKSANEEILLLMAENQAYRSEIATVLKGGLNPLDLKPVSALELIDTSDLSADIKTRVSSILESYVYLETEKVDMAVISFQLLTEALTSEGSSFVSQMLESVQTPIIQLIASERLEIDRLTQSIAFNESELAGPKTQVEAINKVISEAQASVDQANAGLRKLKVDALIQDEKVCNRQGIQMMSN